MGSQLKVEVKPKKSEKSTRVGKITRLGDGAGKIIGSQLKVESKKRWKGESFPSITISTWLFASLPNQLYTKSFVCFHIARPPSNPYESFCPSYTSKEICSFSVFKFFLISSDIVTWSFLSTPYPIHQNGAIQLFFKSAIDLWQRWPSHPLPMWNSTFNLWKLNLSAWILSIYLQCSDS